MRDNYNKALNVDMKAMGLSDKDAECLRFYMDKMKIGSFTGMPIEQAIKRATEYSSDYVNAVKLINGKGFNAEEINYKEDFEQITSKLI